MSLRCYLNSKVMLPFLLTRTLHCVNSEGGDEVRAILRSLPVAQESGGAEAVVAAGGVYVPSTLTFHALNNIILR